MSKSNIKQCLTQDRGFTEDVMSLGNIRNSFMPYYITAIYYISKAYEKWKACSFLAKAVQEFRANVLY